jgi:hypothetical protein
MAETKSVEPNPALKELEILVGEWDMELSAASFLPDPSATIHGQASFKWLEGGDFLIARQGSKASGPPYSTSIIGRDEMSETYMVLYFDDRGVSRVYQMSLEGRQWKQWRQAPGFFQRFTGTFSADGNIIDASWEKSNDGSAWQHDFNLTYKRKN